ncbi:hypothetical protein TcWFU_005744 [Taenia crassiceps]|uniref:Uncharacterized protein n=1 Tax=Taenia crassiceps TaxID=6207 RepID=A0ABR4QLK2_9CEST
MVVSGSSSRLTPKEQANDLFNFKDQADLEDCVERLPTVTLGYGEAGGIRSSLPPEQTIPFNLSKMWSFWITCFGTIGSHRPVGNIFDAEQGWERESGRHMVDIRRQELRGLDHFPSC